MANNTHSLDLENGSSQYASIADASQTGLDLSGDFTLEAWVKIESLPGTGNRIIMGKHGDNGDQRAYRLDVDTAGKLGLIVTDDGTWTNGHRLWIRSPLAIPTGIHVHVAVSFNIGTETAIFYVNGVAMEGANTLDVGTSLGATLFNSNQPFAIGCDFDPSNAGRNFWDGLIDEVRVWSDIRTATEIADNIFADVTG